MPHLSVISKEDIMPKLPPRVLYALLIVITILTALVFNSPSSVFAKDFEVWLVDQSDSSPSPLPSPVPSTAFGGRIYIYDGVDVRGHVASSATPTDVIDLAGATATMCLTDTGANPRRPHMLLFNATHTHAILSFVTSGHVVIFDAGNRLPLKCFRMSPGAINPATGAPFRQAHAAFPSPDDSYIVVANQNGKLLERIKTDYATNTFEHETAATLNLLMCTTPNGVACQLAGVRPDNAPICPIIDSSSTLGFITLRGGGLFVVDFKATPMAIAAEYDRDHIHGDGCGGLEAKGNVYINSGAGSVVGGGHLSEFDVYKFPLSGYDAANPPNTPTPVVVFSDDGTDPERDSHGMAATGKGKFVWVLDRLGNVAEVFSTKTDAHVNTVDLSGPSGGDTAPDLLDIAPGGNRLFGSLRGPNPLTGDPHVSTGSTPGLGVIQVSQGGKNGLLKSIVPIHNLDVNNVERADAHGIRVRLK
jgi:hypothetical protein